MTARRMTNERLVRNAALPEITDEVVDLLRERGASVDLIEYADRHVARFSQVDIERAQKRAMLWTLIVEAVAVLALVVFR